MNFQSCYESLGVWELHGIRKWKKLARGRMVSIVLRALDHEFLGSVDVVFISPLSGIS